LFAQILKHEKFDLVRIHAGMLLKPSGFSVCSLQSYAFCKVFQANAFYTESGQASSQCKGSSDDRAEDVLEAK
jgi:hypothetical protein